mmetsp:Transcript_18450/g.69902  ORF Transcript_18450/g.69902 Transcript_18450/m.69902 type:complete len:227 (-) Transcript_18450:376-1056(-)
MARSMTARATRGTKTLMPDTAARPRADSAAPPRTAAAASPPAALRARAAASSSSTAAACITMARAAWRSIRDWATSRCVAPWASRGLPKARRPAARRTAASRQRSASPTARMQWWIRPGPRRAWAISMPRPTPSSPPSSGAHAEKPSSREAHSGTGCDGAGGAPAPTSHASRVTEACPAGASSYPNTSRGVTSRTPGALAGTRAMEWRLVGLAPASDTPSTRKRPH